MGGMGSGRWERQGAKRTTEDLPALDVRTLKREGDIEEGQEELILGSPLAEIKLRLVWLSSGFGGGWGHFLRPWFKCPGCDRHVAILYLDEVKPGESQALELPRLLCRICLDLAYPSQRESALGRAGRKAHKAKSKLGPNPTVSKPKGMHHTTFFRLGCEYLEAHREHVARYNEHYGNLQWLKKLSERRPNI